MSKWLFLSSLPAQEQPQQPQESWQSCHQSQFGCWTWSDWRQNIINPVQTSNNHAHHNSLVLKPEVTQNWDRYQPTTPTNWVWRSNWKPGPRPPNHAHYYYRQFTRHTTTSPASAVCSCVCLCLFKHCFKLVFQEVCPTQQTTGSIVGWRNREHRHGGGRERGDSTVPEGDRGGWQGAAATVHCEVPVWAAEGDGDLPRRASPVSVSRNTALLCVWHATVQGLTWREGEKGAVCAHSVCVCVCNNKPALECKNYWILYIHWASW